MQKNYLNQAKLSRPSLDTEEALREIATSFSKTQAESVTPHPPDITKRAASIIGNGLGIDRKPIKIAGNISEVIPVQLLKPDQKDVLCDNQPSPVESYSFFGAASDPEVYVNGLLVGKFISESQPNGLHEDAVSAYDRILKFQKELYGDKVDVKLIRVGAELKVVSQRQLENGITLTQVFDSELPRSEKAKQYLKGATTLNYPSASEWHESDTCARNIVISDSNGGMAADLLSILPGGWEVRYTINKGSPACDPEKKQVIVSEILQEDFVVGLLHEFGHAFSSSLDPETFKETDTLRNKLVDVRFGEKVDQETLNRMRRMVQETDT